jgi:hypothetical protein
MLRTILFPKHFLIGHEVAVCHIHCSLRILVDGCNNSSIFIQSYSFPFCTSICSLPVLVLVVLCSLPVL